MKGAPSSSSRRFFDNGYTRRGGMLVALVLAVAVLGPALVPRHYEASDMGAVWAAPGGDHWLGADGLGRDVLSRLVMGARISLVIALGVLTVTMVVGLLVGTLAGYYGGFVDTLVMRSADIIFAFPEIILAILVASIIGPGKWTVVVALSIVWWPGIARLTRSLVLSIREELYVDAAIVSGTRPLGVMFRHLVPNLLAPILVRLSMGVGFIIMAEATLSFLGLGVQEPEPTWGAMIRDGMEVLTTDPHLALFASSGLAVTIIGFNLLGDGLRDLLDPKGSSR